ncbi:MAG: hypothetical protein QGG50_04395 [Methanopyri archaeon]|nr:hypothetical protein [Methanopyri archaeon]
MENALYVTKERDLDKWEDRYTRLHFGQEFCQRLLPDLAELDTAIRFAQDRDADLTLVTPFVTDMALERVAGLMGRLHDRLQGTEVVVNDLGVLTLIRERGWDLRPVLGRLLTKQKRGPRVTLLEERIPPAALHHYRRSNAGASAFQTFLQEHGVRRVELDNLLQGIDDDLTGSGLSGSLHYPYAYVTTSRCCPVALCGGSGLRPSLAPCGKECLRYGPFRLLTRHMPVPLVLAGTTQFYRNDHLPDDLEARGIDRVVHAPVPPV